MLYSIFMVAGVTGRADFRLIVGIASTGLFEVLMPSLLHTGIMIF